MWYVISFFLGVFITIPIIAIFSFKAIEKASNSAWIKGYKKGQGLEEITNGD